MTFMLRKCIRKSVFMSQLYILTSPQEKGVLKTDHETERLVETDVLCRVELVGCTHREGLLQIGGVG